MATVLVAGATGSIGRHVTRMLVERGWLVVGLSRSREGDALLEQLGARAERCDVRDRGRLVDVVRSWRPDVVVNLVSSLQTQELSPTSLASLHARDAAIRLVATDHLLEAARAAGARHYVGHSCASWYEPDGTAGKTEADPLWAAPEPLGATVHALRQVEEQALGQQEVPAAMLRLGSCYGLGTWYCAHGAVGRLVQRRRLPLIGAGRGLTSFIHVEDAAAACVAAVERGARGVFNVVDDEPAPARRWLPLMASELGAPQPRQMPEWLARRVAGAAVAQWLATGSGASSARLRTELGWSPRYRSWRDGFFSELHEVVFGAPAAGRLPVGTEQVEEAHEATHRHRRRLRHGAAHGQSRRGRA